MTKRIFLPNDVQETKPQIASFQRGDRVNWLLKTSGGYDSGYNVAARVLSSIDKRVRIAIYNPRMRCVQYKIVTPERLSPRMKYCPEVDDLKIEPLGESLEVAQ